MERNDWNVPLHFIKICTSLNTHCINSKLILKKELIPIVWVLVTHMRII